MAITAVNAVIADVVFVTELDGLFALDPLPCIPGRAVDFGGHPKGCEQDKNGTKDRCARQRVGAVMKDLWHRRSSTNEVR